MTDRTLLVKLLLRLIGGVELCAIPFLFFPVPWMDSVHRQLGLGPLPAGPIVEYLARSLSALYAVHGAVVFFISFDVIRYRPLIALLAWIHIVMGLTVLGVDLVSGIPWWWAIGEGPGIAIGGVILRILVQKVPSDRAG